MQNLGSQKWTAAAVLMLDEAATAVAFSAEDSDGRSAHTSGGTSSRRSNSRLSGVARQSDLRMGKSSYFLVPA